MYKKPYGSPKRFAKGPRALGRTLDAVTKPLYGRRGIVAGQLITDWERIVGPVLGKNCVPLQVRFPRGKHDNGALLLRVDGGSLAMELQHLEPQLIERVNAYFGYRAISKISLQQGPLPERKAPPEIAPLPELTAENEHDLEDVVKGVEDDELREILERMGRSIKARHQKKP